MCNLIAGILLILGGFVAGMFVRKNILGKYMQQIKLEDGVEFTMWKGELLKDNIFVCSEKKGKQKSLVVFNKNGNIENVETRVEDK